MMIQFLNDELREIIKMLERINEKAEALLRSGGERR
ncbi:hypothetical protein LR69_01249 [Geobacillus sp. BCO2]|nr:hypothetical protein LR69_01249 [Geobacillus sp. BCO2]